MMMLQKNQYCGNMSAKSLIQDIKIYSPGTRLYPTALGPVPHLSWALQAGPGCQATSQQAATLAGWWPCLAPLAPDAPGSREVAQASLETNSSLPRTALMAGEEGFHINHHYDQNATHVLKQIPVPLWHSPNEHIRLKRDSCWGYKYKNSMTLCSLCGSNLPPPPGPPKAPEEESRVFPGTGVSEAPDLPPARAPTDTILG